MLNAVKLESLKNRLGLVKNSELWEITVGSDTYDSGKYYVLKMLFIQTAKARE